MIKTVSVIGLGKLGLPMALHFADSGFDVIGIDTNDKILKSLNNGVSPIYEQGVQDLLDKYGKSMLWMHYVEDVVENNDATFVIVPTPSLVDGRFSSEYVENACRDIGKGLRERLGYHLVVITSTVFLGTMTDRVLPLLEKESGKKCGKDFGLCYSPEFIALGNVLQGMANPDAVLIGESDKRAGDELVSIYNRICRTNHISRMSLRNAEVTKLALNVFLTMKISFANEVAAICENILEGDADKLTEFLGYDSRIGHKFLKSGLGYSGTCLPRDNRAYMALARQMSKDALLSVSIDMVNQSNNTRIADRIEKILGVCDKTIAILGVTFKPNTDVIEESMALDLANLLLLKGFKIIAYDPAGMGNAKRIHKDFEYAESAADCITDVDMCVLATPWQEFARITPDDFKTLMPRPIIFDCWRFYDREKYSDGIEYYAVGIGDSQ